MKWATVKEKHSWRKKRNNFSPLYPLSSRLGRRQISTRRLHISVTTNNCDISSKSGVHPPGYALCTPPHKPPPFTHILHHSPCLPDIQTSFPQTVLHSINLSLSWPTHWMTTSTLSYIDSLSNSIILHSLHMPKPLENTLINPFITPYNSLICAFRILSILLITSKPLRLSICTVLILDLSFSFHNIV